MPLVDAANPGSGTLAKQLAGPFGKYLPTGQGADADTPKAFMENSFPTNIQSGGDGVTNIDDPTYLGFSLSFQMDSPLFQGIWSNPPDSAVGYLEQVDPTRAGYLRAFLQGIWRINRERPWYWQTITGLTEAWQKNTTNPKDPYVGTAPGEGIEIGCIEAIDLKLTALFSLYRMAVYDNAYRRFILPENLRHFDVNVSVLEIRRFRQTANWMNLITDKLAGTAVGDFMASEDKGNIMSYVNDNTSQVTFKFTDCEWDTAVGGKVFDTVTNVGGDIASTSIKFSYGNVVENSQFSGYDGKLVGDMLTFYMPQSQADGKWNFKDAAKEFAKDQIANQVNGAISAIESAASGYLQKFTLGNVFGLRNKIFGAINNPQALTNAAVGAAAQLAEEDDISLNAAVGRLGGNAYGHGYIGTRPKDDLETTRIFEETVPESEYGGKKDHLGESPKFPPLGGDDNIFDPYPDRGPLDSNNVFEG